jgi:putative hydrolase of the HAD superfamily
MNITDETALKPQIRAVLWDFGGVILTSPFEAFRRYEAAHGLPIDIIRTINATNPDTNAWAKFERSDVSFDEFCTLFEAEALALGHTISARGVMALLHGEIRPQMVAALHRLKTEGYLIALLTNNVAVGETRLGTSGAPDDRSTVIALFDYVVESSVVGFRKPETQFYVAACEGLGVLPTECLFLDDLGINLKPAAAMGIRTIKVVDPDKALAELGEHLGWDSQCNESIDRTAEKSCELIGNCSTLRARLFSTERAAFSTEGLGDPNFRRSKRFCAQIWVKVSGLPSGFCKIPCVHIHIVST